MVRASAIDLKPNSAPLVAPNCKFVVDDIEAKWVYPESKKFDYIHQRNMASSISNWDHLFQQASIISGPVDT
ncbi:hypothetical protein P875_00108998 [Aspergillus parasiticus SU-1]|uniref:Uncharacterized protein n=1 Tax=Aspergillus parasiticus (strain ATCC 56775 / NRRL 5862 / SRRC 143 / SU-1) TaxID=1403190 RepID=A0A0F0IIY5_ASPPU|nr:hypothetical protein P875_00108998 [Aspergillus parasiticus SU-1]